MRPLAALALLALLASNAPANDDPEPPGAKASRLFGKWTGTRMLYHLER